MMAPSQTLTGMDDDFSLFTNAEFFDFDIPDLPDLPQQPVDYDPVEEERARRQNASAFKFTNNHNTKASESINGGEYEHLLSPSPHANMFAYMFAFPTALVIF